MIIDELVTDRTQSDVDRVKELTLKWLDGSITAEEQTEWLAGLKGAYNYTDLNRVGQAVAYLANILNASGRSVNVTAKSDWTMADIPSRTQETAFLRDLTLLKGGVTGDVPEVPSTLDGMTYEVANRIEQILIAVHDSINYERSNWEVSGIMICGTEGVL